MWYSVVCKVCQVVLNVGRCSFLLIDKEIETRFIDERFPSVMGECENVTVKVRRLYSM
jgi:hypothetical protein